MPLSAGTRLGPYEILSALGVGGMGEVYRARDTKLDRAVAIKILPEAFAADTERIARFQREAKTLASLNHPNIAHIHGLEESNGVRALVMELVEGEDLAQRIARGAIPVAEALPIAKQMADALEAAHEQGIIHRDLKPANIKVRPDGTVKVLDFGLAKAMEPTGVASPSVSQSPTITTPAMTQAGMILGTAAYMSPEQARGKPVDKRADIWAFGCVLYEMLTGQRAFDGQGVSETLARVIEREPDWARLPATLSPALRTYLRRCLQKDPRQRVQAIGDVRLALEGAFETAVPRADAPVGVARPAAWRRIAALTAGALAVAAVSTTLTWFALRRAEPASLRVSRLQVTPRGAAALTLGGDGGALAISRDGSRLVYVGNNGTQLFVRALDALEPVAVFTGAPRGPFVSPDGQWIGFADGTALKKVAVTGGPAVTLATLDGNRPGGATWAPDDTIIFSTNNLTTGLQRVAAKGGPTTVLTWPDRAQGDGDHLRPEMLPGGRAVLFTIEAPGLGGQVAMLDLQTGTHTVLVRGGSGAHYVPSGPGAPTRAEREGGYLVYASAGTLWAAPFDLASLSLRGMPVPVIDGPVAMSFSGADAAVAAVDGTLAYVSGAGAAGESRTLVWVDRLGHETPIPAEPRAFGFPRLSPDGTRIAVYSDRDLWVWDLGRTTLSRATFDPAQDLYGVWTPDSRRMIFSSQRAGIRNLFWEVTGGTGAVERLTESPNQQNASAVSPDGRLLIFSESVPKTGEDVMQLTLDGTRGVTPLVQSSFDERNGVVSPTGRWLAYQANDSGRFEIWVRPFPQVNSGQWQVTTTGGTRPLWTRGGEELVYVSLTGALMRVGVAPGPSWAATTPTLLVKEGYDTAPGVTTGRTYDAAPDGQRFLMVKESGADGTAAPASIIVVQHWVEELKRLVPTK